jgi:hypothetical protein
LAAPRPGTLTGDALGHQLGSVPNPPSRRRQTCGRCCGGRGSPRSRLPTASLRTEWLKVLPGYSKEVILSS